ncbi:uncharacterized protein LOC106871499 isoform X4 [Octopus bimaculoides]|uniref:Uncharacterized protein n=2 Tax=Octopus bimaculoides TaxID=37653 RepID=A0A0L8HD83_OCTBM|nr:uncharacterized protein LOC106871499 isoform X4 [Octopus bimaculoides]XP_014773474.1 uncharacterized protein LOC106871499 isoform X4 [Octopus bimaculoides]|eukprot:XP_014773473.1 PREDICTED: uncharacterized protein LOC106871499 isoform X4 [Octopus bimaculoides]
MSGGQPKSLSYGNSPNIPIFEIGGNENEFGVVQSPHSDSYIHSHLRDRQAKGPWVDKEALKPMEINLKPTKLPSLVQQENNPQLTKSQSSKELSVPKFSSVFDECQEEMFQLDDEAEDLMPLTLSQATKQRKMSKSHDVLNETILEMSRSSETCEKSKSSLYRFKSDSNLNHERSDMTLVEKVSLLNLTAAKNSGDVKPMTTRRQVSHESFDCDISDSESKLKNWFLKKPVSISKREINAIAPFP